ncbi:BTBD6-like protein, partial [Mya arenaria]
MANSDRNNISTVCWQYSDEFSETNLHLLENEILSDISFAAGEERTIVRAHKMILASRSPVFFAMFCGLLKETSTVVDIPDIKADDFRLFLKNAIHVVNVCTVLEECLHFQEDQLKEECISFISQNTIAVLKTRSFKNLPTNTVKLLLEDDALNCKEVHIYSALKAWGVCACKRKGKNIPTAENIRDEIGDLIKLIRFPTMSVEDFSKYVAKDLVLTPEEKLASYQDIVLGDKISGYPNTPRQEPTTLYRMANSDRNNNNTVCWQYSDEFSETNLHLLENGILSDISFAAGKKRTILHAHKMILASRSPVFFSMFCGLLKETSTVVDIPDINADVFRLFLKYLYTRSCDTNEKTVTSLLYCAKKYDVPSLQKICRDFLRKAISVLNVCTVLDESLLFQEDQLKDECINFISQNTIAVLKTRSFKNLSSNTVKLLLEDDILNCKEIHIYSALKAWGVCECKRNGKNIPTAENIRDEIGELVKLIRFPTMKHVHFMERSFFDQLLQGWSLANRKDHSRPLIPPIRLEPGKVFCVEHNTKLTGHCVNTYCGTDQQPNINANNVLVKFENVKFNEGTISTTLSTGQILGLIIG